MRGKNHTLSLLITNSNLFSFFVLLSLSAGAEEMTEDEREVLSSGDEIVSLILAPFIVWCYELKSEKTKRVACKIKTYVIAALHNLSFLDFSLFIILSELFNLSI